MEIKLTREQIDKIMTEEVILKYKEAVLGQDTEKIQMMAVLLRFYVDTKSFNEIRRNLT